MVSVLYNYERFIRNDFENKLIYNSDICNLFLSIQIKFVDEEFTPTKLVFCLNKHVETKKRFIFVLLRTNSLGYRNINCNVNDFVFKLFLLICISSVY